MKRHLMVQACLALALSTHGVGSRAADPSDLIMQFNGYMQLTSFSPIDLLPEAWGGFLVSPIGTFNGTMPEPGTIGHLGSASLRAGEQDVEGFLRFEANPDIRFDLQSIEPGIYSAATCSAPAAVGQSCTPDGSGANFINQAEGMLVTFAVTGQMVHTSGASLPWVGQFTAIGPDSYQNFLGSGGVGGWTYVAQFRGPTLPVPEPGTFASMLAGLALITLLLGPSRKGRRQECVDRAAP
jgi:hypothetical protein